MKTEFKARFLQHLNQKKLDKGFTLIELLVVIIIIGILSAIALPSFLNQANKAKQSEAKQYTGSMNRAQQAKYAENGKFADIDNLGLGIKTQTSNYTYTVVPAGIPTSSTQAVGNVGAPLSLSLKGYTGTVQLGTSAGAESETTTIAILCESGKAGSSAAQATLSGKSLDCAKASGDIEVSK
ncbi:MULTISPECIES: type IV pilin-like G/H family protein [unclassified Microcoleus]|uniref:type IV pilin-like G/H family protein n=1 Tax=unclassified Microcoleus TaxID=2642155 RepID=UPI001DC262FC|nr:MULTISPECIES: type IV pilin-like G/H family protein [unclassified Microcoleus]MCC3567085.1 type IV pilin-like G/H family protein [Microcoleus sp. PH2017_31_RDM_U_A]MCC3579486.1 type IV pilin-like G/H family protein [Microcoleus sp. PH2017_32_RDM_D_A]MCC3617518.1 type IV pilin-like G/H family protein [Microcoleus sp. PH2017_38_RDM_U_B]